MNYLTILIVIVLLFLLLASSFFSGSETAFFALNHLEKRKIRSQAKGPIRRFIDSVLLVPEDILITVLTGNMVVNLFFASLMDRLVLRFVSDNSWIYSILIGTVCLLIFGEMTPKSLAIRHAPAFFTFTSRFVYYIHILLTPIRKILKGIEWRVVSLMMKKMNPEERDARTLITSTLQVGLQKGIVHASELSILNSFLDLREKTAEDAMTPRTAIEGIDVKTPLDVVIRKVRRRDRRLPIPVFKEDIDHVVGYINLRDLLRSRFDGSSKLTLNDITNPAHLVPEAKNLFELLQEMMESRREMSLVIDEYGGTAGIITYQQIIEDFLEFFYPADELGIVTLKNGTFRMPGQTDLDELESLLEIQIDSENRTVAGLLMERLETIPARGTELIMAGYIFMVRRVAKNRILEVEVRRRS